MENKLLVVDLLKKSLDKYEELISKELYQGMCQIITYIITTELDLSCYQPFLLEKYILKFNKEFLKVKDNKYHPYWWHLKDTKSRIKAFEKLIDYYSLPENKEKFISISSG